MGNLKRNQYLDNGSSEDEDVRSAFEDPEDARESRTSRLPVPRVKRRKLLEDQDAEDDASDDAVELSEEENAPETQPVARKKASGTKIADNNEQDDSSNPSAATTDISAKTVKPLNASQLAASQKAARKTGVMYLSRIPPFMRPQTVKHLLTPYGNITRLFLTPEPPASYSRRIHSGGNKKRSFIDGWVEFSSRKHAKACAQAINGQIVGGKKGGWYHDDIWNVKYLKGFKWADLMEGVRSEERVREGRLRAEIAREGRERKAFLEGVEKGKMLRTRLEKEESRKGKGEDDDSEKIMEAEETPKKQSKGFERRFRQNEVKVKNTRTVEEQPDEVKRVLSKIF
ncbi:MAG: RNA-binding ATPase activator esf2 [Icmadophila ericetorum]|nr:RNA-binding ATPase activator esf2 [Icmadophila ericetorum]